MNSHDNPIIAMIRAGLTDALDALARDDVDGASAAFGRVQPVLHASSIGLALDDLITERAVVTRLGHGLYATGEGGNRAVLLDAYAHVKNAFAAIDPLLLVRYDALHHIARSEQSLPGISVIGLTPDIADRATLVHELVHGFVTSGHRMIDEGLAEWLAILAVSADRQTARAILSERATGGPAVQQLAARRWTEEPCFESLNAPVGSAHAVAALAIGDFLDRRGMASLLDVMAQLRAEPIQDVRAILGLDAMVVTAGIEGAVEGKDSFDREALRRRFRKGEVEGAEEVFRLAKHAHLANPDDGQCEVDYLLALLLAADGPAADAWRTELDSALDRFLAAHDETPLAYALCVAREGLAIRYAPNFIALSDSFQRGRAIIAAALDVFPDDIDVVATAAKFELYTPLEYGGNPALARSYIQRAAALTDDRQLEDYLRYALTQLSAIREAA
jgi:hypothetical protein